MLFPVGQVTSSALAERITIESPGTSVKRLVAEMSQQSGKHLEAGSSVAADTVIVRFHGVTLGDAMKALSVVETGKWTQSATTTYFGKDVDTVEKLSNAEKDGLVKDWTQFLKKLHDLAGPDQYSATTASTMATRYAELQRRRQTGDVNDFVRMEEGAYSLPSGRALVKVLESLGPQKLANNPSSVVEYATSPDPLQLDFEGPLTQILDRLKSEELLWQSAPPVRLAAKATPQAEAPVDLDRVAGVTVQVTTHAHRVGGLVMIQVYDRNAKIIREIYSPLVAGSVPKMAEEARQGSEDAKTPRWVEFPKLSRQLYRIRDERTKPAVLKDWWANDPVFKHAILNPEQFDFGAEILGRQVLAMADERQENILIPEIPTLARFLAPSAFQDSKINASVLWTALRQYLTEFPEPNWLVIRPTSSDLEFQSGQGSVDRRELGDFVRGITGRGSLTLEAYAQLIKNTTGAFGYPSDVAIVVETLKAVSPDMPGWGWLDNPPLDVAFYGNLSQAQRQQALEGGLDIRLITPANWRPLTLAPYLLDGSIELNAARPDAQATVLTDPFFFCGTPQSKVGRLKFVKSESESLMVTWDGWSMAHNAAEWSRESRSKRKETSNDTAFQPCNRKSIQMTLDFNGFASITKTLHCDTPNGSSVAKYQDLPQDFRDQFGRASGFTG